jgi:hypothetical protein
MSRRNLRGYRKTRARKSRKLRMRSRPIEDVNRKLEGKLLKEFR